MMASLTALNTRIGSLLPKPSRFQPVKCGQCQKTCYPSKRAALKKLRELAVDRALAVNGEKVPVRTYLASCGSWHLTSQQDKPGEP